MNKEEKRLYDREYRRKNKNKRRLYNKDYSQRNKERIALRNREWELHNRERRRLTSRKSLRKLRIEVLTYYGNGRLACIKCGFEDERTLSVDHIVARKHHPEQGGSTGTSLYRWLRSQGYPLGYQTLCMNCNWIKRREEKEYGNWAV